MLAILGTVFAIALLRLNNLNRCNGYLDRCPLISRFNSAFGCQIIGAPRPDSERPNGAPNFRTALLTLQRRLVESPTSWVVSISSVLRGAIRDTIREVPVSLVLLRFPTLDRIAGHAIRFRLRYMRYDPCDLLVSVSYLPLVESAARCPDRLERTLKISPELNRGCLSGRPLLIFAPPSCPVAFCLSH